ncbi:hypothetical protein N7495_003673 [Penicillium taxi]|uniref:uncharacterized protein n=1 Tax=Penicillium taxi TaxID=168475 RepID=UPI00254552F6|nr:uncharacterized protein N7495_003673 [Penicillium taxi]KAJ5898929.1 hypothetical protein N7495_003673 [Penicillium taxi]
MGVNTRRPVLPAPTESIIESPSNSITGTDLATDLSRRTDKTSYSIPDDGSPITVSTRRHRDRDDKLSRSQRDSQTSLLIEYFEGGKGSTGIVSRPSVRVRVTPSGVRKHRDADHIQITDSGSSRKPSHTHRISFNSPAKDKSLTVDDQSVSSNSAEEGQLDSSPHPVEIEFMNREQGSEVSAMSQEGRYLPGTSDISSMPADSMLDTTSSAGPRRKRSKSIEREEAHQEKDKSLLKTPHRRRSRSLSTERIAHLAAEKLSGPPQEVSSGKQKSKSKNKGKSGKVYLDPEPKSKSTHRKRHGSGEEDIVPSAESSLLSTSSNRKSGDQYSMLSGASKSSINNPKLLETVEDAIRRLILPELKELKKDQKVMKNKSKFDQDMANSHSSSTGSSKEGPELVRRLSKHASAPDVMKPKVVLNKDSQDEGIVLSGDSKPEYRNTERKPSKSSETSDAAWVKWGRPDLTEQDVLRRQKSKGLRDAQAAGRVGSALTAASLKHHDSQSSLGQQERRASGSRKSVEGYNDTELVFKKHNVPLMPMRSELDSQVTRTSLLSEPSEIFTPRQRLSHADLSTGSPRQLLSSTQSRTPTLESRYELGMRHGNQSQRDLSLHSASDRDLRAKSQSPGSDGANWAIAAAAAANLLDIAYPEHQSAEISHYQAGRSLSPIQSVVSEKIETAQLANKQPHLEGQRGMEPRLSIDTLSSAPSTNLARSTRQGASPISQGGLSKHESQGPELGYEDSQLTQTNDYYENEESRLSAGEDGSDVDFMDQVKQGQHVARGAAANPQFVHPVGVESAVASLLEPSTLSQSYVSGTQSDVVDREIPRAGSRSPEKSEVYRGSPLKQRQDAASTDETSFPRRMGLTSPPQSVTQSIDDLEEAGMMAATARHLSSPLEDAEGSEESESEINTNPSIIQGPIGGVAYGTDHWVPAGQIPNYDPAQAAAGLTHGKPVGLDAEYYETARNIFGADEDYYLDQQAQQLFGTPPGAKDEGYVSAANPLSPSVGTPKQGTRGVGGPEGFGNPAGGEDPFAPTTDQQRHFSGYSHGVGSPLYDSSTGRGIERIQSKDIVALMDHLTVRDAQRNARDTEILVTLVRSAAEMRNSFEAMKKFIVQQDDLIMDNSDEMHEKTHRALGGPRPLPPSGSRGRQLNTVAEDEDIQTKRASIFKRALKGLSLKSGNDLTKIEGMLEQLLEEVEAMREEQGYIKPRGGLLSGADPSGYEANGNADAPFGSRPPYRLSPRPMTADQRVSTVPEEDEEEDVEIDGDDAYMSAHLPIQQKIRHERAGSMPLSTPPRKPVGSGARSTETTPKADKNRKHKSTSSSIFPKISRWSKTTASSMGDNIRNSIQPTRKERPHSEISRSGSDEAYKTGNYYDPQGDDRLRSTFTDDEGVQQENRPPSPLVPSQVSEAPKYRAHRGSLEIQHPQPRQGPTGRFQSALESQAQTYTSLTASPTSEQWGSNPSLPVVQPITNRYSNGSRLSPISDGGYSEGSARQQAPPRPPKVLDDGPLVPERPPKVTEDEAQASYGTDRVTSRNSIIRSPPTRKPTGPRPLTSGGNYSPKRTRYQGSPMQVDYDDDY